MKKITSLIMIMTLAIVMISGLAHATPQVIESITNAEAFQGTNYCGIFGKNVTISTSNTISFYFVDIAGYDSLDGQIVAVSSGSITTALLTYYSNDGTQIATASHTFGTKTRDLKSGTIKVTITNSVATNVTVTFNMLATMAQGTVNATGNVTEVSAAEMLAVMKQVSANIKLTNDRLDLISANILVNTAQLVTLNLEYEWEEMAFVTASSVAATVVATGDCLLFVQNFHSTGNAYVRKNATAVYGSRGVLIPAQNGLYTCLGRIVSGDTISYVAADSGRKMGFYKRKK
jgi:hypothetical protein